MLLNRNQIRKTFPYAKDGVKIVHVFSYIVFVSSPFGTSTEVFMKKIITKKMFA